MNIRKVRWKYQGTIHTGYRLDARSHGKGQKQFKTKREAELARDAIIRGHEQQIYGVLPEITVKDFIDKYEKERPWKTDSYRERVTSCLARLPFVGKRMAAVSQDDVLAYLAARKTKAASTRRQDISAVNDLFTWAVRWKYVHKNPCVGIERPSLPVIQDAPQRYFAKEDFEKLIAVAGKDAPMWRFMAWTGHRITEALSLEWKDVNLDDGYVVVRRGKGRKQRIVPLLKEARLAFQNTPRNTIRVDKVFGYASDRHACLRRLHRRLKKAGLPRYRLHDLRHTFGSWAASSGVDLRVLAQAMGHTSTTVTQQYAHLHPDYARRELGKMEGRKSVDVSSKSASRKRAHPS